MISHDHKLIQGLIRAMTRAMWLYLLQESFGAGAISMATYFINLILILIQLGTSPYQVLFGKTTPDSHLRVFGSICYVHVKFRV